MTRNDMDFVGGPAEIARLCKVNKSTVSMWFKNKDSEHGKIPYKHAKIIAERANNLNKDWSLSYIIDGTK